MVEFSCVLSAILFTAGNALMVLYIGYEHVHNQGSKESSEKFHELDPTNIQERWVQRLDTRYLWLASSFTNSLAWIVVSFVAYDFNRSQFKFLAVDWIVFRVAYFVVFLYLTLKS